MNLFILFAAYIFAVELAFAATPNYAMRPTGQFGNSSDTFNLTKALDGTDTRRDTGYAEYFSVAHTQGFIVTPWPKRQALWNLNQGPYTRIPYCFVDRRTFSKLGGSVCRIRAAFGIWGDGLGGAPSAETGHSIAFREPSDPEVFCCKRYYYGTENQRFVPGELNCDWDYDNWPADTVAVHWVDDVKGEVPAEATVGYWPVGGTKDRGGRHWIRVTSRAPAHTIAHELGHVMGLTHEHNRWDRDYYLEFRCLNLKGIDEIINRVRRDKKCDFETARKLICEDYNTARQYDAPSAVFIKGEGVDPGVAPAGDGPGWFDYWSIMMYHSFAPGINVGGSPPDVKTAVLVGINRDANGEKIPESEFMLEENEVVSEMDAQFVKDWYPWTG